MQVMTNHRTLQVALQIPIIPSPNPTTDPDGPDTTSSEEQVGGGTITTENTESDPTELLAEAITNQVNEALYAAGLLISIFAICQVLFGITC